MMKEKKEKTIKEKYEEFANSLESFALDGLALGTAIGIMLGLHLKKCIDSLVNDILTPPISFFTTWYLILFQNT